MKLALAIASAIILIVHGLVFYDQFFHKWERHQTAYFDQARTQARNDARHVFPLFGQFCRQRRLRTGTQLLQHLPIHAHTHTATPTH